MFTYYSKVTPKNSSLRNFGDEFINSFCDELFGDKFVCNSPSSLTYEFTKNENECLYKFPMLGVDKNDIKIDFDPVNRTLSVTGKSTDAYTINKEKKSTELKYKTVIAKQYCAEPTLCSLKQGYLYIKFDLDRQSKNVEFKIE